MPLPDYFWDETPKPLRDKRRELLKCHAPIALKLAHHQVGPMGDQQQIEDLAQALLAGGTLKLLKEWDRLKPDPSIPQKSQPQSRS